MLFEIHKAGECGPATLMGAYPDFRSAMTVFRCEADAWAIIPTGRADELKRFGSLYSVAPRYYGGMYVLRCGDGVSCLGFEVADRKGRAVAAWAGIEFAQGSVGTAEHYACYHAAMEAGAEHARVTGTRCPVDLVSELIPFEGKQVCVTYPDGGVVKFRVGKSTGWCPCHLEVGRNRDGGPQVYFPDGSAVALDSEGVQ